MSRKYLLLGIIICTFFCSYYASASQLTKETSSNSRPIHVKSMGKGPKKVLIYCTHYWESYLPDLYRKSTSYTAANDGTKNITLVGKRLMHELQKEGIASLFVTQAYTSTKSYLKSKNLVSTVLKKQKNSIPYFIDIHRDTRNRKKTTCTIHGKTFGRILFVVGSSSKFYKENLNLALSLHKELNTLYPGLSEAVIIKKKTRRDNGEYNQSFSPHSMLLEVGGYENSFEEAYRTIHVVAGALSKRIKNGYSHAKS